MTRRRSKCWDEHLGAKVIGDRGVFLYCTYIYIWAYIYINILHVWYLDVNIDGAYMFLKEFRRFLAHHYIRRPVVALTMWPFALVIAIPDIPDTKDRKNWWIYFFFGCLFNEVIFFERWFRTQHSRSLWKETVAFMTRMIQDVRSKTAVLGNGFLFLLLLLRYCLDILFFFRGLNNGISHHIGTCRQ